MEHLLIQVVATAALEGDQTCVHEIRDMYQARRDVFAKASYRMAGRKAESNYVCVGKNSEQTRDEIV